jgi:hypothetical protein
MPGILKIRGSLSVYSCIATTGIQLKIKRILVGYSKNVAVYGRPTLRPYVPGIIVIDNIKGNDPIKSCIQTFLPQKGWNVVSCEGVVPEFRCKKGFRLISVG